MRRLPLEPGPEHYVLSMAISLMSLVGPETRKIVVCVFQPGWQPDEARMVMDTISASTGQISTTLQLLAGQFLLKVTRRLIRTEILNVCSSTVKQRNS